MIPALPKPKCGHQFCAPEHCRFTDTQPANWIDEPRDDYEAPSDEQPSDERKIVTDYWPKPIPTRACDWRATFDDYDGAPDACHQPVGYGATEQEAIDNLLEDADWDDALNEQPTGLESDENERADYRQRVRGAK